MPIRISERWSRSTPEEARQLREQFDRRKWEARRQYEKEVKYRHPIYGTPLAEPYRK